MADMQKQENTQKALTHMIGIISKGEAADPEISSKKPTETKP
jgi:hypothetical protein